LNPADERRASASVRYSPHASLYLLTNVLSKKLDNHKAAAVALHFTH
jgi:hypothetical protein